MRCSLFMAFVLNLTLAACAHLGSTTYAQADVVVSPNDVTFELFDGLAWHNGIQVNVKGKRRFRMYAQPATRALYTPEFLMLLEPFMEQAESRVARVAHDGRQLYIDESLLQCIEDKKCGLALFPLAFYSIDERETPPALKTLALHLIHSNYMWAITESPIRDQFIRAFISKYVPFYADTFYRHQNEILSPEFVLREGSEYCAYTARTATSPSKGCDELCTQYLRNCANRLHLP